MEIKMLHFRRFFISTQLFFLVVLLSFPPSTLSWQNISNTNTLQEVNTTIIEKKNCVFGSFQSHSPIRIVDEQGFIDGGFSGNGTKYNPYLIENLTISTSEEIAIAICNVSVYYSIKNCIVEANRYGVYIENTSFYEENTDSYLPIATFANNTCYNSWKGMYIVWAWNCTIQNNYFLNNTNYGLHLVQSWYSTVTNNTCSNNFHGLVLYESHTSTVFQNTCMNNFVGLTLWSSLGSIAYNNLCIYNSHSGIELLVNYVTLYNNTCSYNGDAGIETSGASSSTIMNNFCTNNKYGMYIKDAFWVNVTENDCSDNDYGLFLTIGVWYATFTRNNCTNNNIYGIYSEGTRESILQYNFIVTNTFYGLYFTNDTEGSVIAYNTVKNNNLGGTSQAYDDGEGNVWFDEEHQMGNHWSDWNKEVYKIDGLAGSVDLYPLDENLHKLPLTTGFNSLYLILSTCIIILFVNHQRRKKS